MIAKRSKVSCWLVMLWMASSMILTLGAADEARAIPIEPAIDAREGATYWHWVGMLRDQPGLSCPITSALPPDLAGWTVRPLFAFGLKSAYAALNRFCVFEYDGPVALTTAGDAVRCLDEMDGVEDEHGASRASLACLGSDFENLEPDTMAVVPVDVSALGANTDPGIFEEILAAATRSQVGAEEPLPIYSPAPRVRLTLIDTSPDDPSLIYPPSTPESSPHGESLRQLARQMLCGSPLHLPPADCVAEIHSSLALAYTAFDAFAPQAALRDEVNGGLSGRISELAEVIVEELDRAAAAVPALDRLVINLSVAWDRLYGGTRANPEGFPPAVRAVYHALEAATCEGALVIAAAGNLRDLHRSNWATQPLMPAGWAGRPAPACSGQTAMPLLRAASAFDARRLPVSNALDEGISELVAYGGNALVIANPPSGSESTPPLTGSSVATLVVSSAAAAVAYYDDSLSSGAIMDRVWSTGELIPSTTREADFCAFDGTTDCPPIHYVSLCEAARDACLGVSCAALASWSPCPPRSIGPPDLSAVAATLPQPDPSRDISAFHPCILTGCDTVCRDDLPEVLTQPLGNEVCPRRQAHSASRRAGTQPQPEVGLCPGCFYRSPNTASIPGTFYASVTLKKGESLEAPTLHLECPGSRPGTTVAKSYLVPGSFDNGKGNKSKDFDLSLSGLLRGCTSATLSYSLRDGKKLGGSTTVPILIAK